ncbi:unnamed protein product [Rhizophagus irregularis]|nr:unnamed protein product [Rhizophagus irregularis]
MPPKPSLPSPQRVRTPSPPRAPSPRQSEDINPPKGFGGVINEKVVEPVKEAIKDKVYTSDDLLDRSGI